MLIVSIFGIFRINWVQDITSLLPQKDIELSISVRDLGMMKNVTVVAGPAHNSQEELLAALSLLENELKALPGIETVTTIASSEKTMETVRLLMSRAPRLYRNEKVQLTSEDIEKRLAGLKERLASPEAIMMGDMLLSDPLGFARDALSALEGAGRTMGATLDSTHILSSDRKMGLISATINFDPMQIDRAQKFVKSLDDLTVSVSKKTKNIPIFALGGVYYSAKTSNVMIRDVSTAFILTIICVVGIFVLFFRGLRVLPAALLPSVIGICFGLGVMGLLGVKVHAVTVGFAATISGISIDYVIHLLFHAKTFKIANSESAMSLSLKEMIKPITLGFITTAGAFAVIAASGFTGVKQLAVFSLISLPAAFFTAVFAVPSLHKFLIEASCNNKDNPNSLSHRIVSFFSLSFEPKRLPSVICFFLLFCVLMFLSLQIKMSGDPRDLGYDDPEIKRREQMLATAFPGMFNQTIIATSGNDEESALRKNDELYNRLLSVSIPKNKIISLSPFLPSKERQHQSLAEAEKLFAKTDVKNIFGAVGFKEEYIESLISNLSTPPLLSDDFMSGGLAELVKKLLHKDDKGLFHCITLVNIADDKALAESAVAANRAGAQLISERLRTKETLTLLQHDIIVMLGIWLIAAMIFVSAIQRSVISGILSLLPAVFGVLGAVAVFSLLKRPLTPVASAGFTLVIGLGIDYGIFMLHRNKKNAYATSKSVAASALTTIAGFGVLSIARVRAMSDIGLIILVGIIVALVVALLLLPALHKPKPETA